MGASPFFLGFCDENPFKGKALFFYLYRIHTINIPLPNNLGREA